MTERKAKILIVDDEIFNLDILQTDLEGAGYDIIRAEDGIIAMARLKEHPDTDLVVLDRMMPNMDGMQVIKAIRASEEYKHIPIIMQTAAGQSQQVKEGLDSGVFYYLIKPYNDTLLLSVVRDALNRSSMSKNESLHIDIAERNLCGLLKHAEFRFRTLQDVSSIAYCVASCCPNTDAAIYGLSELMINAVEHGNLGITYLEKLELVINNGWQREVERRLQLPENRDKYAYLTYIADDKQITITIKDQGKGFTWEKYLDFDPVRMFSDPHGKGIAIAKATSFPNLQYTEGGKEMVCRIPLPPKP